MVNSAIQATLSKMTCIPVNTVWQGLFNFLATTGVSRTLISYKIKDNPQYTLKPITGIRLLVHTVFRINFISKIIYLMLLLSGAFPNIGFEFLDYLTVGFWILITCLILISEGFWFRSYPFFEIICAGWKIQNEICEKTQYPFEFKQTIHYSVIKKSAFQLVIIVVGNLAMGVQYTAAPKYPIFTGYLVEEDSTLMTVLFGLHDVGFIVNAWMLYGSVICLSSILGGETAHTLDFMTKELEHLSRIQRTLSADDAGRVELELETGGSKELPVKYSIDTLLRDYRKLMYYVDQLNEFSSYKFLFIHVTAYLQMIGDVFIMIQLLRSGETDFMAIFFYLEDCGVCMLMLYKCFKAMSLVAPASEAFLNRFKVYLIQDTRNRGFYMKLLPTLRPIALKIGPNFVGPETVGNAMMVLLNYYIMAALW